MRNRRLVVSWSLAGLLLGSFSASAQTSPPSLANVARQEAERRKNLPKSTRVYTNDDTKTGGRLLTTAAARPDAAGSAQPGTGRAESEGKEDPRLAVLGTEVLGLRASELRNQITLKEQAGARMKNQILQVEGLIGNAFDQNQRVALENDRAARVAALQQLESEIAALQQQVAQLEEAARQSPSPSPRDAAGPAAPRPPAAADAAKPQP